MTLHSCTYKGKRILLILKTGHKIVTRFLDKKSGVIITEAGRFGLDTVKSMTIYRPVDYLRV